MQEKFVLLIYICFIALGLWRPFIFACGYIWIDLFVPQLVAPSALGDIPVSLIMGVAMVCGFFIDHRNAPSVTFRGALLLVFALWITLTTTWAEVPDFAWIKWNWAFKTVLFGFMIPFLFRTRIQIEAAILTICLSLSGNLLSFGVKTIIAGGGYGFALGLLPGTYGMGEGSMVSLVSAAIVPLFIFIRHNSIIIPAFKYKSIIFNGINAICILTSLGTFARTGLVSLFVLGTVQWISSRRKTLFLVCAAVIGMLMLSFMGDKWSNRMSTIEAPTSEASALGRIAVWEWTIDYASDHPLGGGFDVYKINKFTVQDAMGNDLTISAKAFHSIYFEILGEQGYVGLSIYLMIILLFYISMYKLYKRTKGVEEYAWLNQMAKAFAIFVTVYLCGGAFIGIAFQPPLYQVLGLSVAAECYYKRDVRLRKSGETRPGAPGRGRRKAVPG